jgi:hypothetical protein
VLCIVGSIGFAAALPALWRYESTAGLAAEQVPR